MCGSTRTRSSRRGNIGSSALIWGKLRYCDNFRRIIRSGYLPAPQILPDHLLPIRPVVPSFRSPVVDRVADALAGEDTREGIARTAVLEGPGAGDQPDFAARQLVEIPAVVQVGHVVDRVLKVEVVVVQPVHEPL